MNYKLYYANGSAAMGIRVLLEEIGEPYELIWTSIEIGGPRSGDMLTHNPNGWVPVLLSEHGAMYEAGAITVYLCDRHPDIGLAPAADDPERGRFLQWLFFFSSSVQNAFQMSYYPFRFCDSEEREDTVQGRAVTRLREVWSVVDDAVGDNPWVLGETFSAVDIYLYMLSTWISEERGHPAFSEFANLARIADKVRERPSVYRVYRGA